MTLVETMPGGSVATRPAPRLPASPGGAGHPAVRALVELALLDPAAGAAAHVDDLSRAHPVWSVELPDGRRLVVKSSAAERGLDLGIELLVYRMAVWCEPLGAALPPAVVVDEDRHLLVLEDVRSSGATASGRVAPARLAPGRRTSGSATWTRPLGSLAEQAGWPELVHPGSPRSLSAQALAEAVHLLGRTLGSLHRGTTGLPLPPARPPVVLAALTADYPATGAVAEHVASLRADPVLVEAARAVAGPVAGCLVNHDMKWDNVVVAGDRAVLLDWEMAGLGDPAWDLGCLVAEHLVRQAGASLSVVGDATAVALLQGYALGARPRPEVVDVLARRTVLAAGLRVAQLGLEVVDTLGPHRPASPERLSERARSVLASLDTLTEEVAQCLH